MKKDVKENRSKRKKGTKMDTKEKTRKRTKDMNEKSKVNKKYKKENFFAWFFKKHETFIHNGGLKCIKCQIIRSVFIFKNSACEF